MAARYSFALRRLLSTRAFPARGGEVSAASGVRLTDQQGLGPRRFYDTVDVKCLGRERYTVILDGTAVRTPKRSVLEVPTHSLAISVASEWDSQEGRIRPSSMPLTTLTTTALDVVPEFRSKIISSLVSYIHTDTCCIRPSHPKELVDHQTRHLDVVTDHIRTAYGYAVNIDVGGFDGAQSRELCEVLCEIFESANSYELAALDSAAATSKSVLLAVALRDGALDCTGALEAARSEERWQAGVWGLVEGGHDTADADTSVRLGAADYMFRLIESEPAAFSKAEDRDRTRK